MNDQGVQNESTFVLRRLVESFKVFGKEIDGIWWLPVIGLVLLIALVFVVWMYVKDSRSVRWYWSVPLATTRICVYLLLAGMFLMPAQQLFEREDKRSRVIVVLDVSDSMAQISDDSGAVKSKTRLTRVLDLLSDEQVGFMHALAAKNPVHVYRLGNRLDDESQLFEVTREIEVKLDGLRPLPDKIEIDFEKEKSIDANESAKQDPRVYAKVDKENKTRYYLALPEPQHRVKKADGNLQRVSGQLWTSNDWNSFATYDFKPWLLRGLSEDGAKKVTSHPAWEKDVVGNAEWAQRWHEKKGEGYPNDLSADDKSIFEDHREKLMPRVDVARSLTVATNVPDSLLSLVNREAGNMVQGIVVFSDGQSNLGNEAVLQELRQRSNNEKIPLFTVGIGSERKITAVRITDVQAPEQTPPDEGFKIIIEQDGEGLVGQKAVVNLEIQLPGSETIIRLPSEILYQPGEPPHGQTELLIDPEKIEETSPLRSKLIPKELVEGDWKIRAATPKVEGERFADKEHVSEWQTISVKKKAQRILVMCSAPNRDFQFLVTQLLRDKADMSLLVQNTGGTDGKINLLEDPERQLTHFPTRLDVTDKPTEDPKEKWYNLARYDVIIAFDPDWEKLSKEQILMIQTWVDLNAGGLLYVAGHIHTKTISRPEMDDRYTPLNAILPVLPGDPDLAAAKRTAVNPWRLEFENLADMDFMKLDDELPKIETGWERFFTGREERDEKHYSKRQNANKSADADADPHPLRDHALPDDPRRAPHQRPVERIDADQWRVPADLPERGQSYDLARDRTTGRIRVLSPTGLGQQIGHDGATWLDRELTSRQRAVLADRGFGRAVADDQAQTRHGLQVTHELGRRGRVDSSQRPAVSLAQGLSVYP